MSTGNPDEIHVDVERYCTAIGANPLLVQGAGGNVSWKEAGTLWIKASGTWLADAAVRDIFVPTDLTALRAAIAAGDFSVQPRVLGATTLRPSIETLLHALLPHRFVVHAHAIEALARLVRHSAREEIHQRLGTAVSWLMVDYHKPGADLAAAVQRKLVGKQADVVFLLNHGVIVGGQTLQAVQDVLDTVTSRLRCDVTPLMSKTVPEDGEMAGYRALSEAAVQSLALDPACFDRLKPDWALYPDHVVFLGAQPNVFDTWQEVRSHSERNPAPELLFLRGVGAYALPKFSLAKRVQLECYAQVMARQSGEDTLAPLSMAQIGALLDWDAEQYRQGLAK